MKQQMAKIRGHAEHLLDRFLNLRESYSLLHPMLFDEQIAKTYGAGRRARGFKSIRNTLFLACSQELAKLSFDTQDGSISVANVVTALGSKGLVAKLRKDYVAKVTPYVGVELDELERASLDEVNRMEADARGKEFDESIKRLRSLWMEMSSSDTLKSFKIIRNKVSAHTDVNFEAGKYKLIDIAKLGIKWKDVRESIALLQDAVEHVGIIVRGASFAWDSLDKNLEKAAQGFWAV